MPDQSARLVFGNVELRLDERRLMVDGQPVALGSRGFDLLKALVSKRDRVVSKDELLDEVWPGLVVEENNLQVQVSGLRRVLGTQAVATVAGFGYRFTLAPTSDSGLTPLPETPAHRPAAAPPTPMNTTASILVADDNKVNRLLLCRSLELMGHRVGSAENGQQALTMLKGQHFDLLLLDLTMPELDGFGLLQLRAEDAALREVSVIVTSAMDGVAPVARCIELGADDFLHKPVDAALLKARVASSLARKLQRDQQNETLRRLAPGGPGPASRLPNATVLVARAHGLDRLAPHAAPQETLELLSNWCTLMFDAIAGHGGEVAQFSGDGLTVLFNAPAAAVRTAQDIAEVLALFNAEGSNAGHAPMDLGLGIASGPVLVGTALTNRRAAYVCIGAPVLRAEALATASSQLGHAVLMDDATRADLGKDFKTRAIKESPGSPAFTLQ